MGRALLLNASFEPLCVVPMRRAVVLVLKEKAEIIVRNGAVLHSERAQLPIRQIPLRLEMGEHRDHDLPVDVVDDHQREDDREDRPRIAARRRTMVGGVVRGAVNRDAHRF